MKKLTIEFFHDILCSYCFPMSYMMRKISKEIPDIEIVHRSFALLSDLDDFKLMFGSREAAKEEIISHWEHANQIDELHRFNIDGMKKQEFLVPFSMPSLYAAKAAELVGDQSAYWDVFDNLQHAFFVENKDVGENEVIYDCIKQTNLDFEAWKYNFGSERTKNAVEEDFKLANKYNIEVVPTLIINGKYKIAGSYAYDDLIKYINKIYKEVKISN